MFGCCFADANKNSSTYIRYKFNSNHKLTLSDCSNTLIRIKGEKIKHFGVPES